ncbi:MAG: hypothetical protein PVF54_01625 [Anaerolineae bacterium]
MSRRIDELIWRAFTDSNFRKGLLNGRRTELVDSLGLTTEEREAVLAVKADTLEAFAGVLYQTRAEPGLLQGRGVA